MNIYDKSAAQGRSVYFGNDTRPLPHPTPLPKKKKKKKEKKKKIFLRKILGDMRKGTNISLCQITGISLF